MRISNKALYILIIFTTLVLIATVVLVFNKRIEELETSQKTK